MFATSARKHAKFLEKRYQKLDQNPRDQNSDSDQAQGPCW